jgi:hypothetical protein
MAVKPVSCHREEGPVLESLLALSIIEKIRGG